MAKKVAKKTKIVKKAPKKKEKAEKKRQKKVELKFPDDPALMELLDQIAGGHGYKVTKTIFGEELTDEEVAKRTGIHLNLVRRILYDLYDNRVVSYRRVRDERSGWYIYYWKVEPERALDYINANKHLLLQKLEEQLEREKSIMYFSCNNGDPKVPFDLAAENDFKCPKCGGRLEAYDNSSVLTSLERRVQALRQQLVGS
ncbi:MAG: transcription factor E [Hadesarchaea archaeon]|nr:transcription factor E [Hadesarchaea archaeon]